MGKFSRITRTLIFIPVAVMAWFNPTWVHAESDPLPFTPANNGCGPYQALTVTGTTGGPIWGSNPYTDDSKFSAAAVHAGLIAVGETAIIEPYMVDNYPSYKGSTANGISTYDWGGSWCGYYIRILGTEGDTTTTTTTTTTTLPPYLNQVTNLIAVAKPDGSVDLGWDAPTPSNVDIYAYSVSFYDLDEIGGTASGGWGVWTNQGTTYSLAEYMFSGSNPVTTGFGPVRFGIKAGNKSCFSSEGPGSCVYGQETTVDVTVLDPTPPSTTTTEPETTTTPPSTTTTEPETTTTQPETTTTTEPETTTTEPETTIPETTTVTTTTAPEPETTTTEVEVPVGTTTPEETVEETVPESTEPPETTPPPSEEPIDVPEDVQDAADAAVDEIFTSSTNIEELSDAVDELVAEAETPEELAAVIGALLGKDLTDEQFSAVIDSVFAEALTDENFSAALDAVFDEPLSDEQFDSVITAILDEPISNEQFEELVGVLESDSVTEEQVAAAVDEIIQNDISEEQAVDLATSAKVLESIDGEQAAEIFDAVDISAVTDEEAAQLVEAVQDAPVEVKEAFEGEINIFEGAIDTYVPLGSEVSVGTRRVIVAAAGVLFVAPTIAAIPPTAPINGSGNNNPSPSNGGAGSASLSTEPRRRVRGK